MEHPAPVSRMSGGAFVPSAHASCPPDLVHFAQWFLGQPDCRDRFRWVLRDSLDELMDGPRTGRWCYQQLSKTEKTHLGTVVEVNLTKEFLIPNGQDLDWSLAGEDLDCKFSKDMGGWEIPMEMYLCSAHGDRQGTADHAALLVTVDDDASTWAVGLVRIDDDLLRWRPSKEGVRERAYNRDNKRRIDSGRLDRIFWLWGGLQPDLPENPLLHMEESQRRRVLAPSLSGQKRVSALFRERQGVIVNRSVVLTVGQQDDAPKRVRDARRRLATEGIVVLGHQNSHPVVAATLGLPVPQKGEWVSGHLIPVPPTSTRRKVWLGTSHWAVAEPGESSTAVPVVPDVLTTDLAPDEWS